MGKIRADLIAVCDEVPDLAVPYAELRVAKWGAPVAGYCVCPQMLQVYTHYYGGRTIPHLNDRTLCEGCQAERAKRWKGYFGLWLPTTKSLVLGEITHFAAIAHKKILDPGGPNLRGWGVKISRCHPKHNSRCRVELTPNAADTSRMPDPFNILEVLRVIWSGNAYSKRPENPTPLIAERIPS